MKWMGVKPRTVVHVGAHLAQDQAQYDLLGVREVFWCEADAECVRIIQERYPHCRTVQGAFWSEVNKEIDFWLMKDRAQNSAFRPRDIADLRGKVPMFTTTLDKEFMNCALQRPIMLVLDVQGAELHVLKGAKHVLTRVDFLVCEITEESSIADFSVRESQVVEVLKSYKFVPRLRRNSHNGEYFDLMFVRKGFLRTLRIMFFDLLGVAIAKLKNRAKEKGKEV